MKDILEKLCLVRFASLFPLVDRYHFIKDKDGDIWVFREYLHNGTYPKYTLMGKHKKGQGYTGAHLYAKFLCSCDADSDISVFIEDIVTGKQGVGTGTWIMNKFIAFLRTADNAAHIGRIYGDLVNDAKGGHGRRVNFFKRFGFSVELTPSARENITAGLSELHQVGLSEIEEINIEYALIKWNKKISLTQSGYRGANVI